MEKKKITQDYLQELFYIYSYQYDVKLIETKDVKICDVCSGKGYNEREECTDYHRRDYSTFYNECRRCKGDGRLTETIQSLHFCHGKASHEHKSVVPYSQDPIKKKIYIEEEISLKSLLTKT